MNYAEAMKLIDFLNVRFHKAGMRQPWYLWAVDMPWGKLRRWAQHLGYEEASDE